MMKMMGEHALSPNMPKAQASKDATMVYLSMKKKRRRNVYSLQWYVIIPTI
jgi:hypothetical protein